MNANELRNELVDLLKKDIATVTFTKKDGTERVMKATLMPSILPVFNSEDKPKSTKKINEDVIAVFDAEAKDFRSFRIDSLKSFFSSNVAMPDVQGLLQ